MAHDGQDLDMTPTTLVSDLLNNTGAAIAPGERFVANRN